MHICPGRIKTLGGSLGYTSTFWDILDSMPDSPRVWPPPSGHWFVLLRVTSWNADPADLLANLWKNVQNKQSGEVKEPTYQKLNHMLLIYAVMTPMTQPLGSHVVQAQDSASGGAEWDGWSWKIDRWGPENGFVKDVTEIGILLKYVILWVKYIITYIWCLVFGKVRPLTV